MSSKILGNLQSIAELETFFLSFVGNCLRFRRFSVVFLTFFPVLVTFTRQPSVISFICAFLKNIFRQCGLVGGRVEHHLHAFTRSILRDSVTIDVNSVHFFRNVFDQLRVAGDCLRRCCLLRDDITVDDLLLCDCSCGRGSLFDGRDSRDRCFLGRQSRSAGRSFLHNSGRSCCGLLDSRWCW